LEYLGGRLGRTVPFGCLIIGRQTQGMVKARAVPCAGDFGETAQLGHQRGELRQT
jgi:hypothetical protein